MFPKIGMSELLIILVIVVLVFGTAKIAGIGKAVGTAIREFRHTMRGDDESEKDEKTGKKTEP